MFEHFVFALHFMEPASTGWRSDGYNTNCLYTLDAEFTLCLAALITDRHILTNCLSLLLQFPCGNSTVVLWSPMQSIKTQLCFFIQWTIPF